MCQVYNYLFALICTDKIKGRQIFKVSLFFLCLLVRKGIFFYFFACSYFSFIVVTAPVYRAYPNSSLNIWYWIQRWTIKCRQFKTSTNHNNENGKIIDFSHTMFTLAYTQLIAYTIKLSLIAKCNKTSRSIYPITDIEFQTCVLYSDVLLVRFSCLQ